jgi:hypothetical protein
MADTRVEYVNSQQMMQFVDRATPDTFDTDRALVIGVHARRLYAYRKQKWVTRDTAEKVLDAFDLGYLLYTGDIEIEVRHVGEAESTAKRKAQQRNVVLSQQVRYWKKRALRAEKKLQSTPPSLTTCKESVNTLDAMVVTW